MPSARLFHLQVVQRPNIWGPGKLMKCCIKCQYSGAQHLPASKHQKQSWQIHQYQAKQTTLGICSLLKMFRAKSSL